MSDAYENFANLAAAEQEGVHYLIRTIDRGSPVTIAAPHGGLIERGTSEIAWSIAAESFSLYCFEGLERRTGGASLHITSTRFDEPQAVRMMEACEIVVGIHGRKNRDDEASVWVGGLAEGLRDAIQDALLAAGFMAKAIGDGHRLSGRDAANICNRGRRRAGVQLELPLTLRLRFLEDETQRMKFGSVVREALLAEFCDAEGE